MNLFFNHEERELKDLISEAKEDKQVHDVVVDFDGEVLIDPELEQPNVDLDKFKVHVRLSNYAINAIQKQSGYLKALYRKIEKAWNDKYDHLSSFVFDLK
jgi:hypothetical protein